MKVTRIFQTNEFQKNGKRYYINVVELSSGDDSYMFKIMSNMPIQEGIEVELPYLMTDYLKFAIQVQVL
jgi:hypothetical protein